MSKRQWFLVAAVMVLAGCPDTVSGLCETPGFSHGENRGRDQSGYVECPEPSTGTSAPTAPPTSP